VPRRAVIVFSITLVVIGIALIVRTALLGGGIGLLLGALFLAAGAGRVYLLKRRARR
jgi:hypothetical protein